MTFINLDWFSIFVILFWVICNIFIIILHKLGIPKFPKYINYYKQKKIYTNESIYYKKIYSWKIRLIPDIININLMLLNFIPIRIFFRLNSTYPNLIWLQNLFIIIFICSWLFVFKLIINALCSKVELKIINLKQTNHST